MFQLWCSPSLPTKYIQTFLLPLYKLSIYLLQRAVQGILDGTIYNVIDILFFVNSYLSKSPFNIVPGLALWEGGGGTGVSKASDRREMSAETDRGVDGPSYQQSLRHATSLYTREALRLAGIDGLAPSYRRRKRRSPG